MGRSCVPSQPNRALALARRVPPAFTVMPLVKLSARLVAALPALAKSVAPLTVTLPVKVFDPVRVSTPLVALPEWTVRPPLPEMTPETVPFWAVA